MSRPEFLFRHCPICGAADARKEAQSGRRAEAMTLESLRPFWSGLFKEKLFFSYHRCAICGLLYNPEFFSRDQLVELYSNMAPNMDLLPSDAILSTQRGYFDAVASGAALDGGYLEIGPDIGYIVREAANRGEFDYFWLFEPNRAIHDRLRAAALGAPAMILPDMEDMSAVPDGSVGLAVMVHVLDHLLDPLGTLRRVRAKLRPGGTLMIVTHDESSMLRRLMGVRWPPFCLQHPQLYRPTTIHSLLARAGFGNVAVESSRNHFPIDFLVRQAAWSMGLNLKRVPLPAMSVGLRLGNILTLAKAPVQAAGRKVDRLESVR